MALYKNVASQKVAVFAWDTDADAEKTGDAANITGQISKDGAATAATNDVNPTELDATDAPGVYLFDLTQAESNCDLFILFAKSSTANIKLEPAIVYTVPGDSTALAADAIEISGDSTAADNLESACDNYSAERGLAGTALPISDAGGLDLDAKVGALTFTTANQVDANALAISSDTTTADNLQTVFDGNDGFMVAYAGPRGPGVYLDDAAGNTNTTNGVDGTAANPVSTIAAAKTISDSLGVNRIYLLNDATITLGADTWTDYEIVGIGHYGGHVLTLGSQVVRNCRFENLVVTGTQGSGGAFTLRNGGIVSVVDLGATLDNVIITGDQTLGGSCYFVNCVSGGLTDADITITFTAGDELLVRGHMGKMTIASMVAGNTLSVDGQVTLTLDATCTGGTARIGNIANLTDNSATVTVTDQTLDRIFTVVQSGS